MKTQYKYIGQRYTQGTSPTTLISFVADAKDIKRWGGVPSKNERFHGGFQRALSERYRKITKYFDDNQISPGSIVVAFRPGTLKTEGLVYPSGWPEINGETSNFVLMEFECHESDDQPIEDIIAEVRGLLQTRIAEGGTSPDDPQPGVDTPESSDEISIVDGIEDSEDQDDELDVGTSKLKQFYEFLGNPQDIKKWIDSETEKITLLKAKRNLTKSEKEYVLYDPEEKLRATLISLLRPAMIVDGQHRVTGADESEKENIFFTVSAVKDADWVEQVFQFVVLNKMAKSISKDFLTELLNTSLTNKEVEEIDERLETIGIKNADRKIHKLLNHDIRSPFLDQIAEANEVSGIERGNKISQQGMIALAKRWRSIAGQGKTSELNCFFRYLDVTTLTEARGKWEDSSYETWMTLFFAFWNEIKKLYQPHQIWVKQDKYHLLYIVTLQAMQDKFLEDKASGRVRFSSLEDFTQQVREYFVDVPAPFFQNWTATGLQSGEGWQLIKNAIQMFSNGKQLSTVQRESDLWTK